MKDTIQLNLLQQHLNQMISLETGIEQKLEEAILAVSDHSEATALLTSIQTLSRYQQQALKTRFITLTSHEPAINEHRKGPDFSALSEVGNLPFTAILEIIYTMLNQAVIGYAVLHALATRFLDSVMVADEGTSYHLSRQHMKNYVQAIQKISGLLHDVLLWELNLQDKECQCTCPSCGVGICLCALAGRSYLRDTWSEEGKIAKDEGISVPLPKKKSAARDAGLLSGDVILGAAGQEIETWGDIQSIVRNAEKGEEIMLKVRRNSNEVEDVAIVHP